MKILISLICLIAPSFAQASPLSELQKMECSNNAGSFFRLSVNQNEDEIQSQFQELPLLSSQFMTEKSKLSIIQWSPKKLYGFGAEVTSEDNKFFGILSFLFTPEQENDLPSEGDFRIYYADVHGVLADELMFCELKFAN